MKEKGSTSLTTALVAVLVPLLLAAGLLTPRAVETVMTGRASAIQTVEVKEVSAGAVMTPLELLLVMNGGYEALMAESSESAYWEGAGATSYQVSAGSRHTAETARRQAVGQVCVLLKAADVADAANALALSDGDVRRDAQVSATCHYVVVPTYPVPKTGMIWLCEFWFPVLEEGLVVILDDATGVLLGMELTLPADTDDPDALLDTAERLLAAYADALGAALTAETEGPYPEEASSVAVTLTGTLTDSEGRVAPCTLTCVRVAPDTVHLMLNV